jgi:hypothetical protein
MKPCEAMAEAIEMAVLSTSMTCSMRPKRGKPGELIERMNPEVREALKSMTSDDAKNLRFEDWMIAAVDHAWGRYDDKRVREEFDKKIMACRNMHSPYASNITYLRPSKK